MAWLREATAADRLRLPNSGARRMAAAEAGPYHVFGFGGYDGLAALEDLLLVLPNDPLLQTTVGASAAVEVRVEDGRAAAAGGSYTMNSSDSAGIVVGAVIGAVGFVLLVVGGAVIYRSCFQRRGDKKSSAMGSDVGPDFCEVAEAVPEDYRHQAAEPPQSGPPDDGFTYRYASHGVEGVADSPPYGTEYTY